MVRHHTVASFLGIPPSALKQSGHPLVQRRARLPHPADSSHQCGTYSFGKKTNLPFAPILPRARTAFAPAADCVSGTASPLTCHPSTHGWPIRRRLPDCSDVDRRIRALLRNQYPRSAAFPLLFLLLMIPLPVAVAEYTVSALQRGSAETCYLLFRLMGVPFIRHGFQFSLPGVDIEVAEQCSGIHSGLSLLIAGLLAQHLLLQGWWRRICFTLCILPIAIFKNAVRIVTIAWLGIHVNSNFFYGSLHRRGGLPFSLLAVALMGALLWLLRRRYGVPQDASPLSTSLSSDVV